MEMNMNEKWTNKQQIKNDSKHEQLEPTVNTITEVYSKYFFMMIPHWTVVNEVRVSS